MPMGIPYGSVRAGEKRPISTVAAVVNGAWEAGVFSDVKTEHLWIAGGFFSDNPKDQTIFLGPCKSNDSFYIILPICSDNPRVPQG